MAEIRIDGSENETPTELLVKVQKITVSNKDDTVDLLSVVSWSHHKRKIADDSLSSKRDGSLVQNPNIF